MPLQVLIYILCTVIVIQVIEIIFLVALYQKKSIVLDLVEKDSVKAITTILASANKKAEQIIQNAVNSAEGIMYDSQIFRTKVSKEMDFSFHDAMEQHKKMFNEVMNKVLIDFKEDYKETKTDFTEASKKVLAEIDLFAKKELGSFQEEMKTRQPYLEEYLKQKVDAEFVQAQKEIATFKADEISKTSTNIKQAVQHIIKDVLTLSIGPEQQEKLIMDALEKAKKNTIFSL